MMTATTNTLQSIDEVQITIIMDNSFDLLMPGKPGVSRFPIQGDPFSQPLPIAEHGFSALIEMRNDQKSWSILMDAGSSPTGVIHNMAALGVIPDSIDLLVLSHGHPDHTMGLAALAQRIAQTKPIHLHPDVYLLRKIMWPTGAETLLPPPNIPDAFTVIANEGPVPLFAGHAWLSGRIARTTHYEKGVPAHMATRGDGWYADPDIIDDQCLIMHVRNQGLVMVTGCCHSGIINTIRYAQKITGVDKIHAIIGGFHLSGKFFEAAIPHMIRDLSAYQPDYLIPCHCTGWTAMVAMAQALPQAFSPSCVGTKIHLQQAKEP